MLCIVVTIKIPYMRKNNTFQAFSIRKVHKAYVMRNKNMVYIMRDLFFLASFKIEIILDIYYFLSFQSKFDEQHTLKSKKDFFEYQ